MTVDHKIASHICNVIRRQVQSAYPDLRLFFIVHKENERAHTYIREKHSITDHPCYNHLQNHLETAEDSHNILNQCDTEFSLIARHNNPGFAGLFKKNSYLALCFVNNDRFDDKDHLKNEIYHIAWHAISLYKNYIAKNNARNKDNNDLYFSDIGNILQSSLPEDKIYEQNLLADFFSCAVQASDGSEEALKDLFTQRIEETLNGKKGILAENYPFPACLEQIEFFQHNFFAEHSSYKSSVLKAVAATENFVKSYDPTIITQWHDFAYPAQRMAWAKYDPEVILGAALFTGEKTHIQSIADMISERANIAPQNVIDLQDYNPFTVDDVNNRQHLKICETITNASVEQAFLFRDYKKLVKAAIQKNSDLTNCRTLGWCAFSLYTASKIFKHAGAEISPNDLRTQINAEIEKITSELHWEVLSEFSTILFNEIRISGELSLKRIKELASHDDKFIHIYAAISEEDNSTQDKQSQTLINNNNPQNTSVKKKNIRDFISPNAIIE